MNTNETAVAQNVAPQAVAPIVPASQVAPVVSIGTGETVSDEMVSRYCEKVIAGKPTGKIFPNKLSVIAFTDAQRDMIRAARATHRLNCMVAKREILSALRSRHVQIIGSRENAKGSRGAVRWANEKLQALRTSEIFGAEPKASK